MRGLRPLGASIAARVHALRSRQPPPERLARAIRAQQQASEILVGWVQLTVVLILGVLYILAPKTFGDDAVLVPVPWALSAYLLFTLGRLSLAYRRQLTAGLLYLSVVVDMALLLGLIWSFHVQYEQPAAFYLKVPTLLYVFIFIALRALRFEARYVLFAGLVAAAGWLCMVGYAVSVDSAATTVTRDYVEYMTANRVLLGAEFDKIVSILLVTAILAVAITRARRLLIRSVVEGATARGLSRFVPAPIARQVASAEADLEAGQGEVREATILFTDIEGFTALSESLRPEQVIRMLNEYLALVSAPIEAHGGVINQYQGDAILATFNVPQPLPDHAGRAVRAAIDIQGLLGERSFGDGHRLRTRIGINTGVVIGGLVGTAERLSYTVHGDDVNLAARLEQINKQNRTWITLSQRTCELAGMEEFPFERIGTIQVRGRRRPTVIYTLPALDQPLPLFEQPPERN